MKDTNDLEKAMDALESLKQVDLMKCSQSPSGKHGKDPDKIVKAISGSAIDIWGGVQLGRISTCDYCHVSISG